MPAVVNPKDEDDLKLRTIGEVAELAKKLKAPEVPADYKRITIISESPNDTVCGLPTSKVVVMLMWSVRSKIM